MDLAGRIAEIRKESGLTQEEFAGKLFVTRQAVSRWENGETTPTVDTLKMISERFKVDANVLLGTGIVCQSCAMPLRSFDEVGANTDNGVNPEYCKYCFNEGKFCNNVTVDEMIEINLQYLGHWNSESGQHYTAEEARGILKQYLPTLKRWTAK